MFFLVLPDSNNIDFFFPLVRFRRRLLAFQESFKCFTPVVYLLLREKALITPRGIWNYWYIVATIFRSPP